MDTIRELDDLCLTDEVIEERQMVSSQVASSTSSRMMTVRSISCQGRIERDSVKTTDTSNIRILPSLLQRRHQQLHKLINIPSYSHR